MGNEIAKDFVKKEVEQETDTTAEENKQKAEEFIGKKVALSPGISTPFWRGESARADFER